ncbi:MAG: NUDIX domain-containing protein [Bacteroidales bacterium]|nr:NUDIX domain-containing protein [Bacteroidales bacterium]
MNISKFNIRVYGILIDSGRVLLSDELRLGIRMTKFPGGGLRFGEGTRQCLQRECMEELGQPVKVGEHIYTTDYFQPTELLPVTQQLISIYYRIYAGKHFLFRIAQKPFDFESEKEGAQSLRWVELKGLRATDLTLPVDRVVAGMIIRLSD